MTKFDEYWQTKRPENLKENNIIFQARETRLEQQREIDRLKKGIRVVIPCLEDWIATTGFGAVNRRDREALALLKKLLGGKDELL